MRWAHTITAAEHAQQPRLRTRSAYSIVALLYLAGFLGATTTAVLLWSGAITAPPPATGWRDVVEAAQLVTEQLTAVALALAVARLRGCVPPIWAWPGPGPAVRPTGVDA